MATKTWTNAAGDNLWTTAGNWSPSGVPGATDDVVFNETSSANVAAGAGLTAPASIKFNPGYEGEAGGSSGLIFGGAVAVLTYAARRGFLRIGASAGGVTTANVTTPGGVLYAVGTAGWSDLIVSRGRHFIDATSPVTTLRVFNDAIVDIDSNATAITTLWLGGRVRCNSRPITTANIAHSGTLTLRGQSTVTTINAYGTLVQEGSGTLSTVNLLPDGSVILTNDSKDFTGTTINVYAGYRRFDQRVPATNTNPWGTINYIGVQPGGQALPNI